MGVGNAPPDQRSDRTSFCDLQVANQIEMFPHDIILRS